MSQYIFKSVINSSPTKMNFYPTMVWNPPTRTLQTLGDDHAGFGELFLNLVTVFRQCPFLLLVYFFIATKHLIIKEYVGVCFLEIVSTIFCIQSWLQTTRKKATKHVRNTKIRKIRSVRRSFSCSFAFLHKTGFLFFVLFCSRSGNFVKHEAVLLWGSEWNHFANNCKRK